MNILGAQLYTVRSMLGTECERLDTLRRIKALGYTAVQLFGDPALIRDCAASCRETGLEICGVLTDLPTCEAEGPQLMALCREYGIPDLGVSSNAAECADPVGYSLRLNTFAAEAVRQGLTFSYHNHGHEFIRDSSGKTPMAYFLELFDRDTVRFMPDTYWLHDGGCDVRHFLELTRGRVEILHLKDLKRLAGGHDFAEIGSGSLWFPGILRTALDCGIRLFVVEQDRCDGPPLDSLKASIDYIRSLNLIF